MNCTTMVGILKQTERVVRNEVVEQIFLKNGTAAEKHKANGAVIGPATSHQAGHELLRFILELIGCQIQDGKFLKIWECRLL